MINHLVIRRMLLGGATLGLYGVWVACARLPVGLTLGTRTLSSLWAVALFAAAGAVAAGLICGAAILLAWPMPVRKRYVVAAIIESVCWVPLLTWLLFNELVFITTAEVLGYDTLALLWYNPVATLQAAWAMGGRYLIVVAVFFVTAGFAAYRLSRRSFLNIWPRDHLHPIRPPMFGHSVRLTRSMSGGILGLACLLTWQLRTQPSEALTILFRSAPPLRALNLTRHIIGTDLDGPVRAGGVRQPIISDLAYRTGMGPLRNPAPNVILIVLESVPAKALHCYGYPREDVSPNMDALADQGVLFEHCWSSASFSTYGLVSILTSLYLLRAENNDHFNHFAISPFPTMPLPRALKLAGYETALFSSGSESFDNINQICLPSDYDRYYCHEISDKSGVQHPDCMRMDDRFAVGEFLKWLPQRRNDKPFYGGFYLQSTHFNYEVPEPWSKHYQPTPSLFSNGDSIIHVPPDLLPSLHNQYDNAMRYSDDWVGKITAALREHGQLDNTIIVILGDHGEGFMEHGLARHGVSLWEEMVHIPLIFYVGPNVRQTIGRPLPSHVPDTVSGLDVAPTIAALVGIPPHPSWQGVNVLAPGYTSKDRPIFSILQLTRWQETVCLNKWKYTYDLTDVDSSLFDLNIDPGEQNNVVNDRPEVAARLKSILGTWNKHQLLYYHPANRPFNDYVGMPQFETTTQPATQ